MTDKLSADEGQLARFIATAFERLPPPEPARLDALEDRLVRTLPPRRQVRRAPVWYWWLVGALAVSGAAAWWAFDEPAQPERVMQMEAPATSPVVPDKTPGKDVNIPPASAEREPAGHGGPVIYRRER